MQKSNIIYLQQQLKMLLSNIAPLTTVNDYKIIITIDPEDTKSLVTNFDFIMNYNVLPSVIGKELTNDNIFNFLVTARNEIPLWIKVSIESNVIILQVSKRFRKRPVIKEFHKNSKWQPFILL